MAMKSFKKYTSTTLMNDARIIGGLKIGRMTLAEIGEKINRAPSTTAKVVEAIRCCNRKHAVWGETELYAEYKALKGVDIPVTSEPVLVNVPPLELKPVPSVPALPSGTSRDFMMSMVDRYTESINEMMKAMLNVMMK